jgi:Fibrinogen beta and gamma chains, C-terminal globular domain
MYEIDLCSSETATGGVVNFFGQQVQVISGWIVWMRRAGSSYNWNLTWDLYKNGFGTFDGDNFWLGLERVYQLTKSEYYKYKLKIEMKEKITSNWYSVEYSEFSVENEDENSHYELKLDQR